MPSPVNSPPSVRTSSVERGGAVEGWTRLTAPRWPGSTSVPPRRAGRRAGHTPLDMNKNAASVKLSGAICVSDWPGHPVLPRTPSLELSVLPNGGGQIPGLARSMPTDYDIDGAEGDRTPDLCIANAALSQLSYSPASALVRDVCYPVAPSRCQTATAPRPCGAAVTDTNLAGHPTLSTRRRMAREVTVAQKDPEPAPPFDRSTPI